MESLSETRKRKEAESGPSTKKKRNTGSETMNYLRIWSEQDFELRKEELELKKSEINLQREQQLLLQNQIYQQLQMMNKLFEKFTKWETDFVVKKSFWCAFFYLDFIVFTCFVRSLILLHIFFT